MADPTGPNPSNRDVQRNVNRNTNEQVQSIRKLVQGVPPGVEGAHNPDGSYVSNVTNNTQNTKQQSSTLKQLKKQQISIFQLLVNSVNDIKGLLTGLINAQKENKQNTTLDDATAKALSGILTNFSSTLANSISKGVTSSLLSPVNDIKDRLSGLPSFTSSPLKITLTEDTISKINGNLSAALTANVKDLDLTLSIAGKVKEINLNPFLSTKIDDIDITSTLNNKIIFNNKQFNDNFNGQLTGLFKETNFSTILDSKIQPITLDLDEKITVDKVNLNDKVLVDKVNIDGALSALYSIDTTKIQKTLDSNFNNINQSLSKFVLKINNITLNLSSPDISDKKEGGGEGGSLVGPKDTLEGGASKDYDLLKQFLGLLEKTLYKGLYSDLSKNELTGKRTDETIDLALQNRKTYLEDIQLKLSGIYDQLTSGTNILTGIFGLFAPYAGYQLNLVNQIETINSTLSSIDNKVTTAISDYFNTSDAGFYKNLTDNINSSLDEKLSTIPKVDTTQVEEKVENVKKGIVGELPSGEFEVTSGNIANPLKKDVKFNSDQVTLYYRNLRDVTNLPSTELITLKENNEADVKEFTEAVRKFILTNLQIQGERVGSTFKKELLLNAVIEQLKSLNVDIDSKEASENTLLFLSKLNLEDLLAYSVFFDRLNKSKQNLFEYLKPLEKISKMSLPLKKKLAIKSSISDLIKRRNTSDNALINKKLSKLQQLEFWNKKKLLTLSNKAVKTTQLIGAAANKPENFSLRNFLTNFGAYVTLEEVLTANIGNKLKSLGKSLSGIKFAGEGGLGGLGKGGISLLITKGGKLEELKPKFFEDFIGNYFDTDKIKDNFGKLFGKKGLKDLLPKVGKTAKGGLGGAGKAAGAGAGAGAGALGTAASLAGGAFVVGTAALAARGAYKATDWDNQIGNTTHESLTPKWLGGTRTDGAFASLNHFLGEGAWARTKTAWKTGKWSKLWGANNLLDNLYTEAEHKALISLGKAKADQLKSERQQKIIDKTVDNLEKKNIYAETSKNVQLRSNILDRKKENMLNLTGETTAQNNFITATSNFSNQQISNLSDTIAKQQKTTAFQARLNVKGQQYYGSDRFLDALSKERKWDEDDKKTNKKIHADLMKATTVGQAEFNKLPLAIRLQSNIQWAKEHPVESKKRWGATIFENTSVLDLLRYKSELESDRDIALKADDTWVDAIRAFSSDASKSDVQNYKRDVLSALNNAMLRTVTNELERKKRLTLFRIEQNMLKAREFQNSQNVQETNLTAEQAKQITTEQAITNTPQTQTQTPTPQSASTSTDTGRYHTTPVDTSKNVNNGTNVHIDGKSGTILSQLQKSA